MASDEKGIERGERRPVERLKEGFSRRVEREYWPLEDLMRVAELGFETSNVDVSS